MPWTAVQLVDVRTNHKPFYKPSITDVEWSKDGRFVYHRVAQKGAEDEWWAVDIETGARHQIELSHPGVSEAVLDLLRPSKGYLFAASLSPDGRKILYARTAEGCQEPATPSFLPTCPWEVWTAHADGSQQINLGQVPVCSYFGFVGWFDRGRQVLVSCDYEGPGHWRVIDLEQNTMDDLTRRIGLPSEDVISWDREALSPGGYFSFVNVDSDELWIVSLLERDYLRKIQLDGAIYSPVWSQDGKWLFFLSSDCPSGICVWRYSLETGKKDIVVYGRQMEQLSSWSTVPTIFLSPKNDKAVFNDGNSLWMVFWENQ